jgi:hypothetical protein
MAHIAVEMDLLIRLKAAGVHLSLVPPGDLWATPAQRVTPELAELIARNKAALVQHLVGDAPDRDCWPHSSAMNTAELETMAWRLEHFVGLGLPDADSDFLADQLLVRDREGDDRASCAECQHGGKQICPDGVPLPIRMLHRCRHFIAGHGLAIPATTQAAPGLTAIRQRQRDWLAFVEATRAADAKRLLSALKALLLIADITERSPQRDAILDEAEAAIDEAEGISHCDRPGETNHDTH